jgi:RNA polymerase sigma-70 factor (ECF subfamily)
MNKFNALRESELITLLRNGDERAFGQVFDHYYTALCFFSARLITDKTAAEDIVQEILYKLWHKHADFESMQAIKAFLYISTRNASLNYLDKEKRKDRHHQKLMELPEEVTDPVLNDIIYTEALREIAMELDCLPDQCGKVIKMIYQDGLKPQEIADLLGITVSTVYNQKMRGIGILKGRLSAKGFGVLLMMILADRFLN